ncbi:hypothetical protein GCM10010531_21240 [Blastococcus jejuensis]|uniref:Uncharacterized protein n=1 Tax=Blastococcus jejuensis TaxID=351224 RepID=A0ABP6P5N9_9ACTN
MKEELRMRSMLGAPPPRWQCLSIQALLVPPSSSARAGSLRWFRVLAVPPSRRPDCLPWSREQD